MTQHTCKDYTTLDIRITREMVESDCTIDEIAKRLGRTYGATGTQIHKLGLRLRRARYTPEQCERILTCSDNELLAREMGRTPSMIISKRYKLNRAIR